MNREFSDTMCILVHTNECGDEIEYEEFLPARLMPVDNLFWFKRFKSYRIRCNKLAEFINFGYFFSHGIGICKEDVKKFRHLNDSIELTLINGSKLIITDKDEIYVAQVLFNDLKG